ncbi:MAG: DMT family transporter, partial [Burkholderiales bacterium]
MSISLPAGRNQTRLAVFSLLVAGLLWGLTWMPLKFFGTQGLNGPLLALASYGPIGLLAVPWLIWRRQAWWQERGLVTLFALTGGAANICFVSALMNGEVVRVMLLFYLAPVWGVLGGRLFLSEPLTKLRITGVLLAVTGALLLLGGPALYATPPGLVDLLALAAGFFYALQNIATRAAHATSLDAKTLFIFVGCGALSAIVVGFNGQSLPPISSTL